MNGRGFNMTAYSNPLHEKEPKNEWFTITPNYIERSNINPYEARIYTRIKSVAGETGYCTLGIKTMAYELKMSKNTVKKYLHKLETPYACFGNRPLIIRESQMKDSGADDTYLITIVNVWDLNNEAYEKMCHEKEQRKQEKILNLSIKKQNRRGQAVTREGSSRDPKEERYEEERSFSFSNENDKGGAGGESYEQSPPDYRSCDQDRDIVFNPKTYRLLDGNLLSIRMQRALAKYSDKALVLDNIKYYENHAKNSKTPILFHEKFLQYCLSENHAMKEVYRSQNQLFAKLILTEKKVYGMIVLKTVVKFKDESISLKLPPEQFKKTLEHILNRHSKY
jgi:hypothetical protein